MVCKDVSDRVRAGGNVRVVSTVGKVMLNPIHLIRKRAGKAHLEP